MSVEIISGFASAALGNERDVFVYLPPGYSPEDGPYPVVIAHDGQHLFSERGLQPSWDLDRTLDRLIGDGRVPPLVVAGVSNAGADRGAEYSHVRPYPRDPNTRPRGEQYESLLVDELLPLLRRRYAISDKAEHTAVMGSSMGGLVSYHLSFRRPDVFGLAAVLSPFLVAVDPDTLEETCVHARFTEKGPSRLWIDIGGMEGLIMVRPVRDLVDSLIDDLGYEPDRELRYRHDPDAIHHEHAWAERVESALLHLFGADGPPTLVSAVEGGFAVGELLDPAPTGRRADGCVYSVLTSQTTWSPAPALERTSSRLLRAAEIGVVDVVSIAGASEVTGSVEVLAGDDVALVEVVIVAPDPADDPAELVYFSGLLARREAPGRYRGSWRLPRGVGLNGTVSRGWRIDGLDEAGDLVRRPVRADRDRTMDIRISGWTVPDDVDPHHS
ncbi:MAG: alpha/beta hydrolase [Microbacterium sp.]|nr:alpha/beta hydrolase [Microbacterium sp.]